jgi:aminopeptidase N
MARPVSSLNRAIALAVLASIAFAAPAAAVPAFIRDFRPGDPDPHSILWEPKQAAWDRLQEALAEPRGPERRSQDDFDVTFYKLKITITTSNHSVAGTATIRATSVVDGLTTVVLDLYDNMTVSSVTRNSVPLVFARGSNLLTVTLDQPFDTGESFELAVQYSGQPVNDAFSFSTHGGQAIASSLSEPSGARQWWPCKDTPADKADSARIWITVPGTMVAASEGTLISVVTNGNGTKTYKWFERSPITSYLISVAATNYSSFQDYYRYSPTDSMPISNFVYPEDLADAQIDLDIAPDAIAFYASIYGEYPFLEEKYGHAEFPWGGAMEHQTCTSYGAVLFRGDHYYDWVLVHELSHMWWGDCVTCRTWENVWLNEGFASYSEALWFEHLDGFQEYKDYMAYFDYYGSFNGPIYDPIDLFGRTVYKKGAWVLHMLRHVLGDRDDLLEVLSIYRAAHEYGTAVTSEFQAAAEQVYGGSLDWFFQEWVYGVNRPRYQYAWVASNAGNHWDLMLHVDQVQTDCGLYTMPIDIRVQTPSGPTTFVVWNNEWHQDFYLTASGQPTALAFDPDNWILKQLSAGTGVPPSDALPSLALFVKANPFTDGTGIAYNIPAGGPVKLAVYDVSGKLVATLLDREVPAGAGEVAWNGTGATGEPVAAGVYFCRLTTESGDVAQKLLRLR